MEREDLADLYAFVMVATEGSFTRAAAKAGTSQSSLSRTVRKLESRLGIRLLNRTTRHVSPTAAGERLLRTLSPAMASIDEELEVVRGLGEEPAGTIRITTSRHAVNTVLWPVLKPFLERYPEVNIELALESRFTDIVAERFDAGVRLGEALAQDMVAVRIGPDLRMAVVGSPAYLEAHPAPKKPKDLSDHRCINLRFRTTGGLYAWELEKRGRELHVRVDGQLTFDDIDMVRQAAIDGFGLAFLMRDHIQPHLDAGELVTVLDDWCPPFVGYHLYYPSRRQHSAAFKLLVDELRYRG
ncbi:MAG: LysR family transcriptional regulator [Deltaproteobacteria bacterium]|nr:LysR family transcriptional regulator [Deltaproteobacteria bacterium]